MQQINLYLPEFRPKIDWLRAEFCGIALILVFGGLIVGQIAKANGMSNFEEKIIGLEKKSEDLKEKAESLKKTQKNGNRDILLRKSNKLRAQIKNRREIEEVISGKKMGNQLGFSRHIKVLGVHSLPEMWLQGFSLESGGLFAELYGLSKKAELVPEYINSLQKEGVFEETKFGYLNIDKHNMGVSFHLSGKGAMKESTLVKFTEENLQ